MESSVRAPTVQPPGTSTGICSCSQPQLTSLDASQPKQRKISSCSSSSSNPRIYESAQNPQRKISSSSNYDSSRFVNEPVPRRQRQISTSSNHSLQQLIVNELPQQRKRKISSYSLHYQPNHSPLPRTQSCASDAGPRSPQSSEISCVLMPLQRPELQGNPSTTQSVYLVSRELSTESLTSCVQHAMPQRIRKISYNNQIAIMDEDEEITEDGSKMVVRLVLPQSTYASLEANEEDSGIGPPPSPQTSSVTSAMTNSGSRLRTPSQFNFDGPFLLAGALDDTKTYPNCANHDLLSNGLNHVDIKLGQDNVPRQRRSPTFDSPPLASPEDKKKDAFWEKLTVILSAVYAVFLVTFGFVIGVADLIIVDSNIGEAYSLYLILVGLLWFLFLHMDVRTNSRRIRGMASSHDAKQDIFSLAELKRSKDANNLPPYLYSHSRHSGSFFLKIGAAGFCFGHLIHSTLLMSRQIFYILSDDEHVQKNCADQTALLESILHPIYSFYQLYMLFKYSSIIINRCKELARFAIMHCLATSLYYWFSMILRETLDSLQHKLLEASKEIHSDDDDIHDVDSNLRRPFPILSAVKADEGSKSFIATLNISNSIFKLDVCHNESEFSNLLLSISPYLYPFSIEYSILVVGIWYILWQNIGKFEEFWKETKSHAYEHHDHDEQTRFSSVKDALSNKLVIHADCHSANRGLFAGLLILVATVVTVILFFVSCAHKDYVDIAKIVNQVSEIGLLLLMIGSALFAYNQMRQLDINPHPISLLDDLLLFLCIPCFLLYGIFSVVPDIHYGSYVPVVSVLLQVIQVVIQTPFIIDGLRRCSNNGNPRAKKPGRELVTFLIICNLAMWIIETFEIKSYETNENRINFYGYPLWAFLSHVTLPLTLFYRFHSSVCLVDIWKSAYEPGE